MNSRQYAARKARGLCRDCACRAEPGLTVCARCRVRARAASKALYHRRAEAGICVECCVPVPGPSPRCDDCRANVRRRNAWRRMDEAAANGTW